MPVPDVSEEEVKSLAESILTRYGIDFTCYEPKSFRRRIVRILDLYNFNSTFELWSKFLKDRNFVYEFMNEISVGMTSMFRDPLFWKELKTEIIKKFRSDNKINIWHSGCSTGEEVYSMAILLSEIRLLNKAVTVATDINHDAMRDAQNGVYHKIKMVENERNYHEYNPLGNFHDYYTNQGTSVKVDSKLIDRVKFEYQNLINDPPPASGPFDIIFCRNVMIYFDSIAKEKILDKFYNALKPEGWLIFGFYDTMLPMMKQNLFSLENEAGKIYKKLAIEITA